MGNIYSTLTTKMAKFEETKRASLSYQEVEVVIDDERFVRNEAKEYAANDHYINPEGNNFSTQFMARLLENRNSLLQDLMQAMKQNDIAMLKEDITVYTGISGIVMLYLKVCNEGENTLKLNEISIQYLNAACENERFYSKLKSRPTFLCGIAGPLALRAVIGSKLSASAEVTNGVSAKSCVKTLLKILPATLNGSSLPNELMYGRAGYLYALLYVKKHANENISTCISDDSITDLTVAIINEGIQYAKQTKRPVPMWWEWHGKEYIGAAHGISGILFMLLCAEKYISKELLTSHIKPTLDYFVNLQYPSGNFPSSITNKAMPTHDKLIHWCHGAPGAVHLLLKASEIWPDENIYLNRSKQCGQVIWNRGLLKKGYGLCHGVSGNTYAFIALWKATKDPQYLYKAGVFAEWCFDYGKKGCRTPDRPLSLFEGIAGVIYLLSDLLQNSSVAEFPAFQGL